MPPLVRRFVARHTPSLRPGLGAAFLLLFAAAAPALAQAPAGGAAPAAGRRPEPQRAEEAAIRAAARAYVTALARGDAAALVAMWTPDGDIVDDDGVVLNGRESVAGTLPVMDADARPKVSLRETNVRFLSTDVAVEDGEVEVTPPGAALTHTGHFTALWVRREDGWKLAGLRESRLGQASGNTTLADLEWMLGDWTVVEDQAATRGDGAGGGAETGQPTIEVSVRWDEGRSFLLREMKFVRERAGERSVVSHITQRIGWDPVSRQLRSWSFSGDGGRAESTWSRDGSTWIARSVAVMPDGTQTSSLNLYTYDGVDRCTWRTMPTHVGGEHVPQTLMTMIRKKKGIADR